MAVVRKIYGMSWLLVCLAACGAAVDAPVEGAEGGGAADAVEARSFVASATPQQAIGKTPRDVSQSFEIIRSSERLYDVIASLETDENGPIPSGEEGVPWRPAIDFDDAVMAWISLGYHSSCGETVTGASAEQTASEVNVEITVGAPGCYRQDAECYPYAFVELPRSDLPYTFTVVEELPACH